MHKWQVFTLTVIVIASSAYAGDIQPYRSESVRPYQAQSVKPYQAQGIEPYQAQSVKPDQAQSIEPFKVQSIQPDRAQRVERFEGEDIDRQGGAGHMPAETRSSRLPDLPEAQGRTTKEKFPVSAFFGVWRTNIPGAVWQSPSNIPGYNKLHVSTGVEAGDLTIFPNGNYIWNSYGGKKGKWKNADAADYPIVLIDTVEKKKWKVGFDGNSRNREIIVWDGSIWYRGRK